ncbi:MAG: spore coat protein [Maledivibacter sp.]|nr:spore coat protein [Maledivibacter sp.]
MSYDNNFSEKELLNDLLMSEKQVTSTYNTGIIEAACFDLISALNICLSNVQNCHFEILEAMNQRGWHELREADSQELENTKKKFMEMSNELL